MNKKFLDMAIAESKKSVEQGSSPFGAVIVRDGVVISRAHNTVVKKHDPTAHAEINAIRLACKKWEHLICLVVIYIHRVNRAQCAWVR